MMGAEYDWLHLELYLYAGPEQCTSREHRGQEAPQASYMILKPVTDPPIAGPDKAYVCEPCLGLFVRKLAIEVTEHE